MKRILGYVVSLLAAGSVVGAALPACATNDQTIFIRGALAPSANRQGGLCVWTNDPQQTVLFRAGFDVGLSDSYFAILLVGNQLIARGDPQNNRAESNRAHINGGVVRVTEAGGAPIDPTHPDGFTSLATGFNDPQTNNAPGYSVVGLVAVDKPTRDILAAQLPTRQSSKTVLINVKVFGTTLGGVDLESGEYQFPMQVCNGCLVNLSDGYEPTSLKQPRNCDKAPEANATQNTGPCFLGQDLTVSCRDCKGRRNPDVCDPSVP